MIFVFCHKFFEKMSNELEELKTRMFGATMGWGIVEDMLGQDEEAIREFVLNFGPQMKRFLGEESAKLLWPPLSNEQVVELLKHLKKFFELAYTVKDGDNVREVAKSMPNELPKFDAVIGAAIGAATGADALSDTPKLTKKKGKKRGRKKSASATATKRPRKKSQTSPKNPNRAPYFLTPRKKAFMKHGVRFLQNHLNATEWENFPYKPVITEEEAQTAWKWVATQVGVQVLWLFVEKYCQK